MISSSPAFIVSVGLVSFLAIASSESTTQAVFRVSTTLVHINVEVRDASNRIVQDLRQEDFKVFEGGREQHIVYFLSEKQPLDLLFLLDVSSSMRRRIRQISDASREALDVLRPGDRVSIVTFDTGARVTLWPTENLDRVQRKLREVTSYSFNGGTSIHAAIVSAAQVMRDQQVSEQRRRAVLIITDNLGRPTHQEETAINGLREADASLNGLVIRNRGSIKGLLLAGGLKVSGRIDNIVSKTGGDQIEFEDAKRDLPRSIERIRTEYSLYYKPEEGDDIIGKNNVELSGDARRRYPDAHVTVRQAYITRVRNSEVLSVR